MGSGALTRSALLAVIERLKQPAPMPEPIVICHPIQLPFLRFLYDWREQRHFDVISRWYFECLRKRAMGMKTGDPRWTDAALIAQYTARIEALTHGR